MTEKVQGNTGKLSGKSKIKLVAVTPFGEGLNPMAFSMLTTASQDLLTILVPMIDIKGAVKLFKLMIDNPNVEDSHAKVQNAVKDLDLV